MSSLSVLVGVRVRPFSQREIDNNSQLCVNMSGNQTTLFNPGKDEKSREYYFDYSLWSHDNYKELENGYVIFLKYTLSSLQMKILFTQIKN